MLEMQESYKKNISYTLLDDHNSDSDLFASIIMQLLLSHQSFSEENGSIRFSLAYEIASITQNRIKLIVFNTSTSTPISISQMILEGSTFPLQWDGIIYGILYLQKSSTIPLGVAEKLAYTCAWLIRLLEDATYIQKRRPLLNSEYMQRLANLTKREFEVLQLMIRGDSTEDISKSLFLSKRTVEKHQMHIYKHLNVSSSQDAILVGLLAGSISEMHSEK